LGQVLLAGGESGFTPLGSVELYNPATGLCAATGAMAAARRSHGAALLPTGRVLVAGGWGAAGPLASAELYNPATGTWSATGSLNTARYGATATPLSDGRVLIAGGRCANGAQLASAEVYNPATGTFTVVGPMRVPRASHTATLLTDGRVLLVGGGDASGPVPVLSNPSAELFVPGADAFAAAPAMLQARMFHAAAALTNGKVLVTGGEKPNQILSASELFDPGSVVAVHRDPAGNDLELRLGQNPARGAMTFAFQPSVGERWQLEIFDVAGRRLLELASGTGSGTPVALRWSGQDQGGARSGAGVYWARLGSGARQVSRAFVLLN
jgi:hypothetical protein